MFPNLRRDIRSVFDRDPAARTTMEILLCYPGLKALWGHRLGGWLWRHRLKLAGRLVSEVVRLFSGIEIHPGAKIGRGLFMDHGMGIVIGETAEIGDGVTIYHGVTLGGTRLQKGKRHPTIGDRVTIGAGAKVLGPIEIGNDSRIGANAVVVKSTPPNSVVVGVPGQIVSRSRPHTVGDKPDLEHAALPDLVGVTLQSLLSRMDELERRAGGTPGAGNVHQPEGGVWRGEDFSI